MSKLVRSNVYVTTNSYGGVYETTDDPDRMKVTLEQVSVWWEGDKLKRCVRRVEHFTDVALFKKGTIMPGNILIALQTEPVLPDDPEGYLWYLEDGSIAHTPDREAVYGYFYYSPLSKYSPDSYTLADDDIIEHFTEPSPT